MLKTGESILSTTGSKYRTKRFISAGGQGEAYEAVDSSGGSVVIKLYHPNFRTEDCRRRLKRLLKEELHTVCSTLCAPREMIDQHGLLGHVTPQAPGVALEELLTTGTFDVLEAMQSGAALAHSFAVLHERGLAHGDPHSNNVLVHRNGGCHIHLIDFDNFVRKRLPPAPCLGHHLYMAPEIRRDRAAPSPETDCFGLAVMLHELLVLRHLVPADATESEFTQIMSQGKWLDDPACSSSVAAPQAGYPSQILDANLARLFRAGVSLTPTDRPSAAVWRDALFDGMFKIFVCPQCGSPNILDASKSACPMCHEPYPVLALEGSFGRIRLDRASVVLGRNELGGSEKISKRHAIIRRIGPEYRVEDRSSNGVARQSSSGWVRLPRTDVLEKQPLIREGDRLRFADVECRVVAR